MRIKSDHCKESAVPCWALRVYLGWFALRRLVTEMTLWVLAVNHSRQFYSVFALCLGASTAFENYTFQTVGPRGIAMLSKPYICFSVFMCSSLFRLNYSKMLKKLSNYNNMLSKPYQCFSAQQFVQIKL